MPSSLETMVRTLKESCIVSTSRMIAGWRMVFSTVGFGLYYVGRSETLL